jgi:hypothetical protein
MSDDTHLLVFMACSRGLLRGHRIDRLSESGQSVTGDNDSPTCSAAEVTGV